MNDIEKKIEEQNPGFTRPVLSKDPSVSYIVNPANRLSILAATAMIGGGMPYIGSRGEHRGECRKPKNLSNDPYRAPGMQGFPFRDGQWISESEKDDGPYIVIHARTLKAAKKKLALLTKNGIEPTPEP